MKPTTVLLTVILFVGVSCVTNDKTEIIDTTNCELPEPVKEESWELPPPPPDSNPALLPAIISLETVHGEVGIIETPVYTIGCDLKGPTEDYDVIPPPKEEDSIRVAQDDSKIFLTCNLESEAEYPGGIIAWQRYLNTNMHLPDSIDDELQSDIKVTFVVDEEGNVCEAKASGGSKALCEEAVRVVKQSGKWVPAKQLSTGRCVRSYKVQPFRICFEVEE